MPEPILMVEQPVTVTLLAWEWIYLTGWAEAHRTADETANLTEIFAAIGRQVKS